MAICRKCGAGLWGVKVHCLACARARDAIREPARAKVQSAIRRGELIRQPCEVCGALRVHAHHDDYSKPLEVRWLCRPHHTELHSAFRKQA